MSIGTSTYGGFGPHGAAALATALQLGSFVLTSLAIDLGFNAIGDEGAAALASALVVSALASLTPNQNEIGMHA